MAFSWFYDVGLLLRKRMKHTGSRETKLAPSHFLFMFHSSEGRAQHEGINEGKTDDLKNNKDSERGFLHAAKGGWYPIPFRIISDH